MASLPSSFTTCNSNSDASYVLCAEPAPAQRSRQRVAATGQAFTLVARRDTFIGVWPTWPRLAPSRRRVAIDRDRRGPPVFEEAGQCPTVGERSKADWEA